MQRKSSDPTLSQYDKDANPSLDEEGGHRVGMGVYFIEDTVEGSQTDE